MNRYQSIALKHTPDSISHIVIRKNLTGKACKKGDLIWMESPKPNTKKSLKTFLHECAHIKFNHFSLRCPRYLKEVEAERFAIQTMRKEGLSIPKEMIVLSNRYLYWRGIIGAKRGLTISTIKKWEKKLNKRNKK